jgi:hypothetical protein
MTGKSTTPDLPVGGGTSREIETILACIDRDGLHISEAELSYQLCRRDVDTGELLERLLSLEQEGLIESSLHFRLTDRGRRMLPFGHESPHIVGTPTSWTVALSAGLEMPRRRRRRPC